MTTFQTSFLGKQDNLGIPEEKVNIKEKVLGISVDLKLDNFQTLDNVFNRKESIELGT